MCLLFIDRMVEYIYTKSGIQTAGSAVLSSTYEAKNYAFKITHILTTALCLSNYNLGFLESSYKYSNQPHRRVL